MPREDLSIQQGTEGGPATSLSQGAATQVNDAMPESVAGPEGQTLEAPAEGQAPAEEDVAVQAAEPADYLPEYEPSTEDEDFITGTSLRPDEDQTVGASRPPAISATVRRRLSTLQAAASEPDASPELRALVAFLLREAR